MQTAKFCIYCFWKPQKQFDCVKGVLRTEVGYIDGNKKNILKIVTNIGPANVIATVSANCKFLKAIKIAAMAIAPKTDL